MIVREVSFNSLYGIPSEVSGIQQTETNFQFPLWDTQIYLFHCNSSLRSLSIPFMGYYISICGPLMLNCFQFPLWDTY